MSAILCNYNRTRGDEHRARRRARLFSGKEDLSGIENADQLLEFLRKQLMEDSPPRNIKFYGRFFSDEDHFKMRENISMERGKAFLEELKAKCPVFKKDHEENLKKMKEADKRIDRENKNVNLYEEMLNVRR